LGAGGSDSKGDLSEDGAQDIFIPLLGVNPTIKSLGYGTAIMGHLMSEAAVLCRTSGCSDTVFLEVYTTSARAISLYSRCGFQQVTGEIFNEAEGRHYFVMAKRVSRGGT
jgi:ribosomal protein S18 acetylase RimI-like enzyme